MSKPLNIIFFSIITVLILLIISYAVFVSFKEKSEKQQPLPSPAVSTEKIKGTESFEECSNFKEEKNIVLCKIIASYRTGNADYCKENLNESFLYAYGRDEAIPLLSAKDFCWRFFASKDSNYCGNIKDNGAKQRCINETKEF